MALGAKLRRPECQDGRTRGTTSAFAKGCPLEGGLANSVDMAR
ncbi:heavy metal efflux pump, CzcA family [Burkholderia pseudomallei 305]|nr:heavy metal efflux pump, CzcA family [Burkholderia pseudomallei 305]